MHAEQDGVLLPNPFVVSLDRQETARAPRPATGAGGRSRAGASVFVPRREEVVLTLEEEGMLPAIYFVFSRAGCDRSVRWLRDAGIRLTSREEGEIDPRRAPRSAPRGSTTTTSPPSGSTTSSTA